MSDVEQIYDLFVAANPVPDDRAITADPQPFTDAEPTHRTRMFVRRADQRHQRSWPRAVAAAALAVVAAGAVWGWWSASRPLQPAEPSDPATTVGALALQAVEEWLVALEAGDMDEVLARSGPATRSIEDRRVHEWAAAFSTHGLPTIIDECAIVPPAIEPISVRCRATSSDPVAAELGVVEMVAPFIVVDGLVDWQAYRGGDLASVNAAYAQYLTLFDPTGLEAFCRPAAYEPGTFVQNGGLALTGECAALVAPLAEQVAEWVRNGRPAP